MREIKFRAWDWVEKQMCHMCYFDVVGNIYENPELVESN